MFKHCNFKSLKVEYQLQIDEKPGMNQNELNTINENINNVGIM